jgi:N-acetylglucosaminyl-diphospho-decaprenol L-rhamnosyltransferase
MIRRPGQPDGMGGSFSSGSPNYEVIVVCYRSRARLIDLLSCLGERVPMIVVDNSAAEEPLQDLLEGRANARYIDAGGNLGFGAAANLAARAATRPYLIFVNPDCRPTTAILGALTEELAGDPGYGGSAPALVGGDGSGVSSSGGWEPTVGRALAQAIGLYLILPRSAISAKPARGARMEVGWLAGTCMAVPRDLFLSLGGFGDRYFLYNEDMDLGRRMRAAGLRLILRGDLRVPHRGGGSSVIDPRRLWVRRGAAFRQYVRDNNGRVAAATILSISVVGWLARAVIFQATGRGDRADEMMTYARSASRTLAENHDTAIR